VKISHILKQKLIFNQLIPKVKKYAQVFFLAGEAQFPKIPNLCFELKELLTIVY